MAQPDLIIIPFASDALPGYVDIIPDTLPPGADPQNASWDKGFPPVTMTPLAAGGIPPRGQSFNGVLKSISQHIVYLEGGGNYKWDSEYAAENGYPLGALVLNSAGSRLWLCTVEGNITNPDTGGAGWSDYIKSGIPYATAQEIIAGVVTDKAISAASLSQRLSSSSSVVGESRNLRASVPVASATATFTADEIFLQTGLGGSGFKVPSFNKTLNLATAGAGGMDVLPSPASGFVAIYAIYNPVSGVSALLATSVGATIAAETYSGPNMPVGYTASALLSVWITNPSGQLVTGTQIGRRIGITSVSALSSSTVNASPVTLGLAFLPMNAKFCSGALQISSTSTSVASIAVFDSDAAVGGQPCGGSLVASAVQSSAFSRIAMPTPRQLRWSSSNSAGTPLFGIGITSYEI